MKKVLQAAYLVWQWFTLLGGGPIQPVVKEGLVGYLLVTLKYGNKDHTELESETNSVRGTRKRFSR
jgi:hypothetical protein